MNEQKTSAQDEKAKAREPVEKTKESETQTPLMKSVKNPN